MDALDLSNLDVSTLKKEDLPPPSADEASKGLEYARNRAAVALDHAIFELQKRVYREDNSIRQILDMSDHFAKVSGLLAKQDRQAAQGQGFKLNIVLNGGSAPGLTIEAVPEVDPLANPPALVTSFLPVTDDLVCEVIDE